MTYFFVRFLTALEWFVLVYFFAVNIWYLMLLVSAFGQMRVRLRQSHAENLWQINSARHAPSITVLAPAYNESANIAESLRSLLALHYPKMEVIVVDDGSKDDTTEVMKKAFDLRPVTLVYEERLPTKPIVELYRSEYDPRLIVARKENGGKADTINAALNLASGNLVCAIDADTLIESDALQRMVQPFLRGRDVVAVGETVRVANGCTIKHGHVIKAEVPRRFLPGIQTVEYLRAFFFGRLGWNKLGGNLIISGAFGLFRREAVINAGGWEAGSIGEDLELVIRLRRHGYETGGPQHVAFLADPVAWTEAPERIRTLRRQRERWHHGLTDSLIRHRKVMLNPRYGAMGLINFPYFVFVELLAPVIEIIGIIGLIIGLAVGAINIAFAWLFLLVAYITASVLTTATLAAEEWGFRRYVRFKDLLLMLLWSFLENFGYRQMTVIWRLKGIWRYFRGRSDWGDMERVGFGTPAAVVAGPSESLENTPGSI